MNKGDIYKYNDYELLYYARQNVEEAYDILIWKYSNLIRSKISKLHIPREFYDDYYQEGCLALVKAVKSYDDNQKLPFTNFFEMVLQRHLITVLRKDIKHIRSEKREDLDDFVASDAQMERIELLKEEANNFSEFENFIYQEAILKGRKAQDIATELGIPVKKVYNAKQRLINKLRESYRADGTN